MNEEQNKTNIPKFRKQDINVIEVLQKIWGERKLILKACGIAAVIAIIVAFSLPREYTTKIILAPEITNKSGLSGGMGALASMAGINLGNMTGEDAIFPELYPKIIESTPFLTGLFNVHITTKKGDLTTTLYDYMENHQKAAWWSYILEIPGKTLKWIMSFFKEKENSGLGRVDAFNLTQKQTDIAKAISQSIETSVDKKNDVITLNITMQDPLISALLADTVKDHLQRSIIAYRTSKARNDLVFSEKLYKEAQSAYFKAQRAYADFTDGNMNVVLARYQAESDRLKNEMDLAYNVYNQVAQQLQMAKAKVQERTPVYTEVQPATVPLRASGPRKIFILITFVFLAAFGTMGWILLKDFLQKIKHGK